jgi:hypothetical protein
VSPRAARSFAQGCRAAYVTIYDRHDDADAIEPLKALGQDDHPNVANLIGNSYRKLGDYKLSMARSSCCAEADPHRRSRNVAASLRACQSHLASSQTQSGLMPANLATLPHLSASAST